MGKEGIVSLLSRYFKHTLIFVLIYSSWIVYQN